MKKQETLTHEEIQNGTYVAWVIDSGAGENGNGIFSFHSLDEQDIRIYYMADDNGWDIKGTPLTENSVHWFTAESEDYQSFYPETKEDALERIREILG